MTTLQAKSASLRLAQYLKEFVGLRTTTVRDVTKYDDVLWFGDMPQEPDCQSPAWTDDYDLDDPWLEVRKQQFEKIPSPPELILPWVDEKALKQATPQMPALRQSILQSDFEVEITDGDSSPLVERLLKDHPEVRQAYDEYRLAWNAWSIKYRRCEAIQKVYAELFSLHTQVQKQGEIVEVVLGLGLLDWHPQLNGKTIPVRRHVVVASVELKFDPTKGVIRVVPPGDGARLRIEDDMLEAELRPDHVHYETVESQLEEIGDEIWDEAQMQAALRNWVGALSADSQWSPGLGVQAGSTKGPVMSFAPALILRKRTQTGMARIYAELIKKLSDDSIEVPKSWLGLITDLEDYEEDDDSVHKGESQGDTLATTEIYFPLPANRDQRRIVEAISHKRGVLVQGPPGTGKSHTIANLICHLLATGKRVLITAETGRALQVLKDKLPLELQPLCISLLGQGGDAFAELNKAIQDITTRQAAYTPGAYVDRITEIDRDLDAARRLLAKTDSEIRSLREEETYPHSIANDVYQGSASAIAARVACERGKYAWLRLPKDSVELPQLSSDDVTSWLRILQQYTNADVSAAKLRIPCRQELPLPQEFAAAVTVEQAMSNAVAQADELRSHAAYAPIAALSAEIRNQLRSDLQRTKARQLALNRMPRGWEKLAVRDMIVGRQARWLALGELCRECGKKIKELELGVDGRQVELPDGCDPRSIRSDVHVALEHFNSGGKWKRFGLITPKALKGRSYLRDSVRVDGKAAVDSFALQIVRNYLDLGLVLEQMESAWRDAGAVPSKGSPLVRFAQLEEHYSVLKQIGIYAEGCRSIAQTLSSITPPVPEPDWQNGQAQEWIQLIDAASDEDRLREAGRTSTLASTVLQPLRELHDTHPIVHTLCGAVEARDVNAYSQGYERVAAIEAMRADQERRGKIEEILKKTVPGLVDAVANSLAEAEWAERFGAWEDAWHWAIADSWLQKRSDLEYQQKLWLRRHQTDDEIGKLIAESASFRAWTHFFNRLSQPESAALKSWREAVRAMGKGTGKSAKIARLQRDARRYMDACRDAVPVWIMPRYLVAEMVDPMPGRYDLVIVDEASQLGIDSLFLLYIAKKIVVVGDDQQISPYGVGVADAAIAGLQQHYLDDIPHQHALSAQSSLYGNAKIRFSQNIVLREHFRCMPEIIQFSNDLCYASNGTPLDPLRAYPPNRLLPLVVRHVEGGYRTGGAQYAQNLPEADAIVAQIAACIEDPRYAKATMGVISLQGEAQAKLIERKLLEHLDPAVIEERRLICGDAYAFQGDERNIIFLSMVAAPGEKRIGALTTESARQRFNVAVSRAQDQLWLFHSATLDVLSDACMRYRLLGYMLNPTRQVIGEKEQRFDSEFERAVFRLVTDRGFKVQTQVCVGDPTNHRYRIDLVVEGMQGRLAVECDGDQWHGPERYEHDMARQRDLERAGWRFVRIRGGDFYRDPASAMEAIWEELNRLGIKPGGINGAVAEPPSPVNIESLPGSGLSEPEPTNREPPPADDETKHILLLSKQEDFPKAEQDTDTKSMPLQPSYSSATNVDRLPYVSFEGKAGSDPRGAQAIQIGEGLCRIISAEGPMLAKRAYDIYLRGCDVRRMGGEIKNLMNKALQLELRNGTVAKENEWGKEGLVYSIVRRVGAPRVVVRERGPRDFEEIPPSELQLVARRLANDKNIELGSDAHLRAILDFFDLKRLTVPVGTTLLEILGREYPYVEEILESET